MSVALPEPTSPGDGEDSRPGPVDWSVASRVASWIISRRRPGAHFDPELLEPSFAALTARAEELVSASTGWHVATQARSVVTDRAGWARANVASFERLLTPIISKFEDARETRREERRRSQGRPSWSVQLPEPLAGLMTGAGRSASGAQLGAVLAWMSTRVLGQYDLLLTDHEADDQDLLYYVGSNVVELEERYGFPPEQFRLWLALHEVTHRYQFTAVPWMRAHFLSLVDSAIEPFHADPGRLTELLRRATEQLRSRQS
ncbi:MAG: zinc-dependent metalloprotease, partial [Gaiellaceae bacterium]